MKRLILIISLFFIIFNSGYSQCQKGIESQVIINEIGSFVYHNGDGSHTNAEYIELLVVGDANRPFSPINIKGLIIDDNNSTEIEVGSEPGHIRLSKDFPMVNPGTIILIYDPNGFVVDESDDGVPNSNGIFQIPINSPLIERCNNSPAHFDGGYGSGGETSDYLAECIEYGDEWDEYLPFRNWGDVAQIRTSDGQIVHSVAWNSTLKDLPQPEGSIYFETDLTNKSIQLINGDFSNQSSYRVSGYSSPGEPNSPENEKFINDLKNGVINKFGDFKVTIIKNQTKGNQDAEIEVELLGELDPEIKWKVYVDDVEINNPNKNNPFLIKDLFGGTKTIRVEIWNEESEQFCPFEKTIEIPIDETVEEEICDGECLTLESEGENCVAWIDEDGNVLSNDNTYNICPEKDVIITELIENTNGLVVKKILHNINVKSKSYHLSMIIPNECPPSEVKLMVVGTNLTITWEDGSTEEKKSVSSAGIYKVTIEDENGCPPYEETFTVSEDIFNDSDGDGVCDDKDCNPDDNTQTYKKGDPCDDGQACTINDKYDENCNCVGELPKYGLEVVITGDINICYHQISTTLTAEVRGGWEPYDILWSTGETTTDILIKEISEGGGETYSVTVTDATGCSESASIQLTRYNTDDTDEDGYCDEVDCAPYSAELGGPGSPCDDGDPNTINDVHDENCNCAGVPNPCITDKDGDGVCDECHPEGDGNPNGLVPPCPEKDCNDLDASIGAVGSPCDDGDPNTINDRMNDECKCVGEFDQRLCKGKVTIDIYDGLYDHGNLTNPTKWGGKKVSLSTNGRDKLTDGALTIANLNDTDGDGIIDKNDKEVLCSGCNTGLDEIDLMKLVIKPTGTTAGCKIKIESKGDIAFYPKYTKGTEIKKLEFDATKNTTIWVEAKSVSTKMMDIEIWAKLGGIEKDRVKATAIWVDKKNVYYSETSKIYDVKPTVRGIDNGLVGTIEDYETNLTPWGQRAKDNTRYGFGSFKKASYLPYYTDEDKHFGGRILFEFKIKPSGIVSKLAKYDIVFDIGRRIEKNDILYYPFDYIIQKIKEFPLLSKMKDKANDDNPIYDIYDEDKIPKAGHSEIFSMDAPATNRVIVLDNNGNQVITFPFTIIEKKFKEFVRVSFNNNPNVLKGNVLSGSRCSKMVKWEIETAVVSNKSFNSSDPYDENYHYCTNAIPNSIVVSKPRRGTGTSNANGNISILANAGSHDELYALGLFSNNKFKIFKRNHTNTAWNFVAESMLPTGSGTIFDPKKWKIDYWVDKNGNGVKDSGESIFLIDITDGSSTFQIGDQYYFWIIKVPSTIKNKLKTY